MKLPVIKKITLRDLLSLTNFRNILPEQNGMYQKDTNSVRIYLDVSEWFEFGVYDFGYERDSMVNKILTKKILDSEVTSIGYSGEIELMEIWL